MMMPISTVIFLTDSCPEKVYISSAQERTVSSKKLFVKSYQLWSNNIFFTHPVEET